MENSKQDRVLEIFFRGLRGEDLSVQKLADEYGVSTKSITRSINDLIAFLVQGNTEKPYYFRVDRIKQITVHRKKFDTIDALDFDEGLLRKRSLFMWPGKL